MNHILVKESCSDMRRQARELLRGKWKNAMCICLVYYLLIGGVETAIMLLFGNPAKYGPDAGTGLVSIYALLVAGPLTYGLIKSFLRIAEDGQASIGDLFSGFEDFGKLFLVNLLMIIFLFLWTLLFVIPGIIAALAYAMTYFLIVSNGSLRPREAIRLSKEKMKGNKGKFFLLNLSFIGWILLWILVMVLVATFLGVSFYSSVSLPTDLSVGAMHTLEQNWIIDEITSQVFALILYAFLMPYIIMTQLVFYRQVTGWQKLSPEGVASGYDPGLGFMSELESEMKPAPESSTELEPEPKQESKNIE